MSPDFGTDERTIHELIDSLKYPDWGLRLQAALALDSKAGTDQRVVRALIAALQDADVLSRKMAAVVLALIGPQAGAAVPALIAALRDENPAVRRRAVGALVRIRLEAALAAPALWRAIWNRSEDSAFPLKGMDPGGFRAGVRGRVGSPAQPAALSRMPAATARVKDRLRVLVVEDNRDSADSLRILLELSGYEVEAAYTGPAGVARALEWRPDVLLCDIGLPGMDGYLAVGALRRNPTTAAARMIAVTAYETDEDLRKSHEAGFEQHLVKPVDPEALVRFLADQAAS